MNNNNTFIKKFYLKYLIERVEGVLRGYEKRSEC